jgi:hypothetical protein
MSTLFEFDGLHAPWFIETGTDLGDTLNFASGVFDFSVSIERDPYKYRDAIHRFRQVRNVSLLFGDSAQVLRLLLGEWKVPPAVFWLDAHTDSSPILEELLVILAADWEQKPTILIDDIEQFGGMQCPQWPKREEIDALLAGWKSRRRSENVQEYTWEG